MASVKQWLTENDEDNILSDVIGKHDSFKSIALVFTKAELKQIFDGKMVKYGHLLGRLMEQLQVFWRCEPQEPQMPQVAQVIGTHCPKIPFERVFKVDMDYLDLDSKQTVRGGQIHGESNALLLCVTEFDKSQMEQEKKKWCLRRPNKRNGKCNDDNKESTENRKTNGSNDMISPQLVIEKDDESYDASWLGSLAPRGDEKYGYFCLEFAMSGHQLYDPHLLLATKLKFVNEAGLSFVASVSDIMFAESDFIGADAHYVPPTDSATMKLFYQVVVGDNDYRYLKTQSSKRIAICQDEPKHGKQVYIVTFQHGSRVLLNSSFNDRYGKQVKIKTDKWCLEPRLLTRNIIGCVKDYSLCGAQMRFSVSGSPVFNTRGELIGIIGYKYSNLCILYKPKSVVQRKVGIVMCDVGLPKSLLKTVLPMLQVAQALQEMNRAMTDIVPTSTPLKKHNRNIVHPNVGSSKSESDSEYETITLPSDRGFA